MCVRELTRNRGVARRIVEEATRLADEAGQRLHVVIPADQPELLALAREITHYCSTLSNCVVIDLSAQ